MYAHSSFLLCSFPPQILPWAARGSCSTNQCGYFGTALVCVSWCACMHECVGTAWGGCLVQSLPSLCPVPDVHHKHNQNEEQSIGQASAVPRDPLHGLPDGPQPGLWVSEPLLRRDRGLHPGHRCSPVSGRLASLSAFFHLMSSKRLSETMVSQVSQTSLSKTRFPWLQPLELQLFSKYHAPFCCKIDF